MLAPGAEAPGPNGSFQCRGGYRISEKGGLLMNNKTNERGGGGLSAFGRLNERGGGGGGGGGGCAVTHDLVRV